MRANTIQAKVKDSRKSTKKNGLELVELDDEKISNRNGSNRIPASNITFEILNDISNKKINAINYDGLNRIDEMNRVFLCTNFSYINYS